MWLIRRNGKKAKAHIWNGFDTACRMASTGGLKMDRYDILEDRGEHEICSMCGSVSATGPERAAKAHQDWQIAIEKATRRVLEHPRGVVCKHWVLCCFFSELEAIGYNNPDGFIKAVVQSDDETALTFSPIFE